MCRNALKVVYLQAEVCNLETGEQVFLDSQSLLTQITGLQNLTNAATRAYEVHPMDASVALDHMPT